MEQANTGSIFRRLSHECRVSAEWCLLAVVGDVGWGQALGNEIAGVFLDDVASLPDNVVEVIVFQYGPGSEL